MSDKFERELRDHLHKEAAQTSQFPRALRSRIADGAEPRARNRIAPQLALAGALVLIAVIALGVRNEKVIITTVRTGIGKIIPTATPAPTPQPFSCSSESGGTVGQSSALTAIRPAGHTGYDRVVFDFNGPIPSYDVVGQDSSTFLNDASGQSVRLEGTAGVKIILRSADPGASSQDSQPSLTAVRQIAQIGNFEHQLSYGIGLASPTCFRTFELSNPARLVIDFDTSRPSVTPSLAPAPAPTSPPSPGPSSLTPFTCTDHSGGTATGTSPAHLTQVRIAHQAAGYDRIVFEFAGGPVPSYTVTRQASTHFVKDASGQEVALQGSAGLKVAFHGAAAYPTFTSSTDQTPGLSVVQEAEQIGDFEGVVSWGVGLSQRSCMRTLELSGPTRLAIDIQTP